MARPRSELDDVHLTYPCPVSWESMAGDERVRFCAQCSQNVYNLSAMSQEEAEEVARRREAERVCVGFFRREDGTVVTRECPLGAAALAKFRAARKRLRVLGFVAVMLLLGAFAWLSTWVDGQRDQDGKASRFRDLQPFKTVLDWLDPEPPPPPTFPGPFFLGY